MRSIALRIGVIAAVVLGASGCSFLPGSANDLKVGDCFDPPTEGETVSDVTTRGCTEAHGAEVVFAADYSPATDTYPTGSAFQDFYSSACTPAFNTYTGLDFETDPTYDMAAFKPTSESWDDGDRKVICYAVRIDGETMSQSIKKA